MLATGYLGYGYGFFAMAMAMVSVIMMFNAECCVRFRIRRSKIEMSHPDPVGLGDAGESCDL
jgi:hypothetical protein